MQIHECGLDKLIIKMWDLQKTLHMFLMFLFGIFLWPIVCEGSRLCIIASHLKHIKIQLQLLEIIMEHNVINDAFTVPSMLHTFALTFLSQA